MLNYIYVLFCSIFRVFVTIMGYGKIEGNGLHSFLFSVAELMRHVCLSSNNLYYFVLSLLMKLGLHQINVSGIPGYNITSQDSSRPYYEVAEAVKGYI